MVPWPGLLPISLRTYDLGVVQTHATPAQQGRDTQIHPGSLHESTSKRFRAIARTVQEIRRIRHALEVRDDRAVHPGSDRDPRLADQRLRLLTGHACEAGQDTR
ncbi:hypothetical protein G6F40_016427 [Rhizopus arrhizus]|nr:hypothetical protein G6F40_016427 [Rhizopus arrhizus]